ncbi:MAG TPA: hypothetical protein VL614_09620 [Acetobacteraceae bacterium]|jgi:hypothetical protein|nr:hypothetical protein [Acetobacteraceae bacterium]
MAKAISSSTRTPRITVIAAAIGSLLVSASPAFAALQSFDTARGPAYVTGNFGSLQTTTLPGTGSEGFLENNGNGTSTLLAPGASPQVVATPR